MAKRVARIVDAHVHLWDPARSDWYPYLSGGRELNMGDISAMCRRFDLPTYLAESSRWNVEKFVHVAAAASTFSVEETLELDELSRSSGHPHAIVGGIVATAPISEVEARLADQMASPRFRGIRPMGSAVAIPDSEVLRVLRDRDLVFDYMGHPADHQAAAEALAGWGDLTVVVEHTGWPTSSSDDEFALWQDGMSALAAAGDQINCKLSGLAMPLGSMDPELFRPWIQHCLEVFGVDRCMFASNFPVDGIHGTFDDLYSTYEALTAGMGEDEREKLFAANAERIYRC
jgi:predicted TIM-barrel fold metal-dependent hydrolase